MNQLLVFIISYLAFAITGCGVPIALCFAVIVPMLFPAATSSGVIVASVSCAAGPLAAWLMTKLLLNFIEPYLSAVRSGGGTRGGYGVERVTPLFTLFLLLQGSSFEEILLRAGQTTTQTPSSVLVTQLLHTAGVAISCGALSAVVLTLLAVVVEVPVHWAVAVTGEVGSSHVPKMRLEAVRILIVLVGAVALSALIWGSIEHRLF